MSYNPVTQINPPNDYAPYDQHFSSEPVKYPDLNTCETKSPQHSATLNNPYAKGAYTEAPKTTAYAHSSQSQARGPTTQSKEGIEKECMEDMKGQISDLGASVREELENLFSFFSPKRRGERK